MLSLPNLFTELFIPQSPLCLSEKYATDGSTNRSFDDEFRVVARRNRGMGEQKEEQEEEKTNHMNRSGYEKERKFPS